MPCIRSVALGFNINSQTFAIDDVHTLARLAVLDGLARAATADPRRRVRQSERRVDRAGLEEA